MAVTAIVPETTTEKVRRAIGVVLDSYSDSLDADASLRTVFVRVKLDADGAITNVTLNRESEFGR